MNEHYFTPSPSGAQTRHPVTFRVHGHELTLIAGRGVFSAARLDLGTAVLLRESPVPEQGTVLDLGCGYGPVAIWLAVRSARLLVWAVDVNERARALTSENASAYDLGQRVVVAAPEQVPESLRFDEIWSNPPIRIGKPALHDLLERWLPRLKPDGVARLVVARNLGADSLARWLAERGHQVARSASSKGYRVLEVRPS